ncbi:MAG: tripartite tricarboxylate transporter TctB family protein [Anaerolineales bacterium]
MRRADAVIGLSLLVFAALYFQQSFAIRTGFAPDRLGPTFFPRLLAGALALLALTLIARAAADRSERPPLPPARIGVLIGVTGLTAAYALLLPLVGFLLATPVLIGAVIALMGLREWRPLLVTAIAVTVVLYLVFARFLHVLLPPGLLEGF